MQISGHRFERIAAGFETSVETVEVAVPGPGSGVTQTEDFILYRDAAGLTVYDRVCDHNGGRLITNGAVIACPMHGWQLDPATGRYANVDVRKAPLLRLEGALPARIALERRQSRRTLMPFGGVGGARVRFLNHACVIVEAQGLRFATDPWILGPAFGNGWWLARPSPQDSFEALNGCDFLFISHNHPDHLHPETLARIRRDMPILTPAFVSGSTVRFLRDLGFTTIHPMGFDETFVEPGRELALSCLKSGDFRDDSGLLVQAGGFSAVFGVDANFIDFWRFPKGLTLLANSFAGGASGFPLCFDTYGEEEKRRIVTRNRNAVLATNRMLLARAQPGHFLPYAGFFAERAPRDAYVASRNRKNAIGDFAANCATVGTRLLDVTATQIFRFEGPVLAEAVADPAPRFGPEDIADYLAQSARDYGRIDRGEIEAYFLGSGFTKDLDFELLLTDDGFEAVAEPCRIRFSEAAVPQLAGPDWRRPGVRHLQIRARAAEAMKVIAQGLPWEDLSIGFQCRVRREPNLYNSDFWYHFSNIHVNDAVKTRTRDCAGCAILEQKLF